LLNYNILLNFIVLKKFKLKIIIYNYKFKNYKKIKIIICKFLTKEEYFYYYQDNQKSQIIFAQNPLLQMPSKKYSILQVSI